MVGRAEGDYVNDSGLLLTLRLFTEYDKGQPQFSEMECVSSSLFFSFNLKYKILKSSLSQKVYFFLCGLHI